MWLQSLQMISAQDGWALVWGSDPAGSGNPALAPERTTDGGLNWVAVTPPAALPLLANGQALLYAGSAQRAWLAVNGGDTESTVVFTTTDGGQRWTESNTVAGSQAVAVAFSGAERGWLLVAASAAMGQEPVYVYRTADGGMTWSLLTSDAPAVCDKTGMAFTSAETGWTTSTCAGGYQVLGSRDGGAHWSAAQLPPPISACPDGCSVQAPQFAGPATFLQIDAYPSAAYLLVSENAGGTWTELRLPAAAGPYPRLRFFGPADAIAVAAGSQGVIGRDFFVTSDGGRSWTAVVPGRQLAAGRASISSACGWGVRAARTPRGCTGHRIPGGPGQPSARDCADGTALR